MNMLDHFKAVADSESARIGKLMQVILDETSGAYMVFPASAAVSLGHRSVYLTGGAEDDNK